MPEKSIKTYGIIHFRPFKVTPEKCSLAKSNHMQIFLEFQPKILGKIYGELEVYYDQGKKCKIRMIDVQFSFRSHLLTIYFSAGDKLSIILSGNSYTADVSLSLNELYFPETYLGLTNRECVKIFNFSKHNINYSWVKYESQDEGKCKC